MTNSELEGLMKTNLHGMPGDIPQENISGKKTGGWFSNLFSTKACTTVEKVT